MRAQAPRVDYGLVAAHGSFAISAMRAGTDSWKDGVYLEGLDRLSLTDFIQEAFRFYNFSNAWIRKRWFWELSCRNVDDAAYALRWGYHEALKHQMHKLYLHPELSKYYNVAQVPFRRKREGNDIADPKVFLDPHNKARYAARIYLSSDYRSNLFSEKKPSRKHPEVFHGIFLEQIAPRLRRGRTLIEDLFGLLAPPQPLDTVLFASTPDGKGPMVSYDAISREFSRKNDCSMRSPRLAEHLHIVLGSPLLGATVTGNKVRLPDSKWSRTTLQRVAQIQSLVEELQVALSSLDAVPLSGFAARGLVPFEAWSAGLDQLERIFGAAAEVAESGSIQQKRLGVDWAICLIYLIRWYLLDVRLRTLMTALPIYNFYEGSWAVRKSNSYIGLALYEALSGSAIGHPSVPSILDVDFPVDEGFDIPDAKRKDQFAKFGYVLQETALTGVLQEWPELAKSDPYCPLEDSHVRAFGDNPVLISVTPSKAKKFRIQTAGEAESNLQRPRDPPRREDPQYINAPVVADPVWVTNYTPLLRHAPIGNLTAPDFYRISEAIRNASASQLNVAATFDAQLRFFVACALLSRVGHVTGLRAAIASRARLLAAKRPAASSAEPASPAAPESDCHKERKALEQRLERQRASTMYFVLTAGSNLLGGSFPPHITHKLGDCYDISMGPDLTPWPAYKAQEFMTVAYQILDSLHAMDREKMLLVKDPKAKKLSAQTLYEIHQAPDGWCAMGPLVSHNEMRDLKNEALRLSAAAAETALAGTPRFLTKEDGELPLIGHLCLLVSGPKQIVYASPIAHARALRALWETSGKLEYEAPDASRFVAGGFLRIAERLDKRCELAFFPSDHHNHWHIVYPSDETFAERKLWIYLGLDLAPFHDYLLKHQASVHLQQVRTPEQGAALEEYRRIKEFVEKYIDDYKAANPGSAPSSKADQRVKDLFTHFICSVPGYAGDWLEPAGAVPRSSMANALVDQPAARRQHITMVLRKILGDEDPELGRKVRATAKELAEDLRMGQTVRQDVLKAIELGQRDDLLEIVKGRFSPDGYLEEMGLVGEQGDAMDSTAEAE